LKNCDLTTVLPQHLWWCYCLVCFSS